MTSAEKPALEVSQNDLHAMAYTDALTGLGNANRLRDKVRQLAAERAEDLGREACAAAGVQWLDQTVHASGVRLRRGEDGRLGVERTFRFEYSEDGSDRHIGRLVLRGRRLVGFVGPVRSNVATMH